MIEGENSESGTVQKSYVGIKGWFLLFCISTGSSALVYSASSYKYFAMVKDYNSFGKAWVVLFVAITNLVTGFSLAFGFILVVKRKKLGKVILFYSLIAAAVIAAISWMLLYQTFSALVVEKLVSEADSKSAAAGLIGEFGRTIFYALIWASYLNSSKRVKDTLVN